MVAHGPLDAFLEARSRLIATATPGSEAARALSDLTDGAIAARAAAIASGAGCGLALFALGGYGAQRLLPGSDIDLLVISKRSPRELEPLVRAVLYPLWDAGLTVGHQVRSPRQQVTAIEDDLQNLTAFLTTRFIAGDPDLARHATAAVYRQIRRAARATRSALLDRPRPGSPYLLEPDLKDGAGGQRDIDEIVWHAALASNGPVAPDARFDALVQSGFLRTAEVEVLRAATDAITAARWRVHALHTRVTNVLTLDDAQDPAIDADATQRALVHAHHLLLDVRERTSDATCDESDPLTLGEIERLARTGDTGLHALERAARSGRLDAAVPGFSELMTLRRPALTHRYTVGAHSLRTLVNALSAESTVPVTGGGPTHVHALTVAALTHDVGKREAQPGHADRGAAQAESAAIHFGLDARETEVARLLVEEHLLLGEAATGRDLTDEDVALEIGARLGDASVIAPLFRLTAADMEATGPGVWTPWRASLVAELALSLEAALSPEVDGAGIVSAAESTRRTATIRAASAGSSAAVLGFLQHAPLRYLARRSPDEVLRDAHLIRSLAGPGAPGSASLHIRPGSVRGSWIVDVVTRDRPGLFSAISGSLALSGLDVLAAEAFTDRTGIALDSFTVTSASLAEVGPETWSMFERHLDAAARGRLDLEARLGELKRHYPARSRTGTGPDITVDPRHGVTATVRVSAPDRRGLLYDLATALERADLDIRRALVTTRAGVADDVFEVVDRSGDAPEQEHLEDVLLLALSRAAATSSPAR